MDWLDVGEVVLLVVVLAVVVPVVWLFARRRWLSRHSGMFDCAVRSPGRVWSLGLARYHAGTLQWFRSISLSFRPARTFRQGAWHVVGTRDIKAQERGLLFEHQQVITLAGRDGSELEVAMDAPSVTGFSSWLEAAGPGAAHYGNTSA